MSSTLQWEESQDASPSTQQDNRVPFDPPESMKTTHLIRPPFKTRGRLNQYDVYEDILGKGIRGTVRLARDTKLRVLVAIKIVTRQQNHDKQNLLRKSRQLQPGEENSTMNSVRKEIAVMQRCRHANLVRLLEVLDDPSDAKIYLVMENLTGGPVEWSAKETEEPILHFQQTQRIMRDVILGLEYLHSKGIIHRDIKPQNIVYTESRRTVKLIDFGISHIADYTPATYRNKEVAFPEKDLNRRVGTPSFLAPEVVWSGPVKDEPKLISNPPWSSSNPQIFPAPEKQPPITPAIDIWSLGGGEYSLYKLVTANDWYPAEFMGASRLPTSGRHPSKSHDSYPMISLLDKMLQKNPLKRISLQDIKSTPWILEGVYNPADWAITCSQSGLSIKESWTQKLRKLIP